MVCTNSRFRCWVYETLRHLNAVHRRNSVSKFPMVPLSIMDTRIELSAILNHRYYLIANARTTIENCVLNFCDRQLVERLTIANALRLAQSCLQGRKYGVDNLSRLTACHLICYHIVHCKQRYQQRHNWQESTDC